MNQTKDHLREKLLKRRVKEVKLVVGEGSDWRREWEVRNEK